MVIRRLASVFLFLGLTGCSSPAPAPAPASPGSTASPADRKYLLDRVDDAAIVQLYADGFTSLPLKQKTLIWHLYQAALAGRDIFIDQKHKDALEMREVIEQIIAYPQGVDATTLSAIQRYAKLFWLNNGPYNNLTARKFVLTCTPEQLKAAVYASAKAGAKYLTWEKTIDQKLERLAPMFFDPKVDPIVTNKTPGAGKDILQASANNLYSGVSLADLKGFNEKYGLNSRLVKQKGKLVEEVYKIDGKYGNYIAEIVKHLEAAKPFAEPPMATALDALVKFYRTGETADREAYDIAWVQDKVSPVDTINGFIEVYVDPRGIKGSWEGLVFFVNQEKTQRIKTIATNAQWFEDHMPWDAKYRKTSVQGIVANAIEKYGSKSVALANVNEAYDKSAPGNMRSEFSWDDAEAARSEKFANFSGELTTDMHEVIGHASGQQAEGKANPQALIKEHFSALEEGRADLVGLYFIADPKLVEIGVIPAADHDNIVRAEYEAYTRNAIVQLRRIREGTQIEEDHMRNRQMIVRWLMANTKAIESRTRDGKSYLVMVDPKAFRDGVGKLLAEVQRIKSEGDAAAAAKLFDTYGIHFDAKVRDEVVARVDKLNLPSYSGFVMPKLTPVTAADGSITDVTISYPQDLTKQMLEYSGVRK